MTLPLTNTRRIDPETGRDSSGALTLQDGLIVIRNGPEPAVAEVFDCGGLCLAPGIVDCGVKIGEPGIRHSWVAPWI